MLLSSPCARRQPLCGSRAAFARARVAASPSPLHPPSLPPLPVAVTDCAGDYELEAACAQLRVAAFYTYAPESLLFGPAAQQAEQAWTQARLRTELGRAGRLESLGMRVTSLAAVRLPGPGEQPAACPDVVGTLDLHVGDRLPGEPLEALASREAAAAEELSLEEAPAAWLLRRAADGMASVRTVAQLGARASYSDFGRTVPTREEHAKRFSFEAAAQQQQSPPPPYVPPLEGEAQEPLAMAREAAIASSAAQRLSGHASAGSRAYVFNVAVWPSSRRRGVAARLLQGVAETAGRMGVRRLYVHVEANNEGARRLYTGQGFQVEAEEPQWLAERLGRPRRLLLARQLG